MWLNQSNLIWSDLIRYSIYKYKYNVKNIKIEQLNYKIKKKNIVQNILEKKT